jgi:hypothetical protein
MSASASWSYTATATLWALRSRDGWTGLQAFDAPVQIACDYQAESKTRTDSKGREYVSRLVVYTERAGIKQGDRLLLGPSTVADPMTVDSVEVRDVTRFADTFDRLRDDYEVLA